MTPLTDDQFKDKEAALERIMADLNHKVLVRDDLSRAIFTLEEASRQLDKECNAYLFSNRGTE